MAKMNSSPANSVLIDRAGKASLVPLRSRGSHRWHAGLVSAAGGDGHAGRTLAGAQMSPPAPATVPRARWDPSNHCFHCTDDPNQGWSQAAGRTAPPSPKKQLHGLVFTLGWVFSPPSPSESCARSPASLPLSS